MFESDTKRTRAMNGDLQKKIDQAIRLLQQAAVKYDDIELAYSGGKDSDVILELARMSGIPFTAIYKNTTIDPPGTIAHCKENGVQIVQPKMTFFQLIERKGYPSRWSRFCCADLKKYKIKDCAILGIRREESKKRAELYKEPEQCRVYKKKEKVHQIYPILYWTKEDIQAFVELRGIKLHPLYYREDGSIDYNRRLGCLACPLQDDRGLSDFEQHPKLVKAWLRAGQKWWDSHPNSNAHNLFSDIYECFVARIFFWSIKKMVLNKESVSKIDYKAELEKRFNIKL